MNISKTIREQRSRLSLSQEELAEKMYVSRNTIGNWENDRSYPDVHSLILLSQIFDMTIDQLVKGDLEKMEQIIEKNDIRIIKRCYRGFYVALYLSLAVFGIFAFGFNNQITPVYLTALVILVLGIVATIFLGIKAGLLIQKYDPEKFETFEEIISFTEGKTLDEIIKQRKTKKWYKTALSHVFGGLVAALFVWGVMWFLGTLYFMYF